MTSATVYIHIGAHKAGSTTIQGFGQDNEEALARLGVVYPRVGRSRGGAHHLLAAAAHDAVTRPEGTESPGAELWRQIREERVALPAGHRMLISSERFETFRAPIIRKLPDLVGNGKVRVLIYMRDLAGTVVSAYGQRAKTGIWKQDFDAFFDRYVGRDSENRLTALRSWAEVVGPDNVRVQLLDPRSLVGGDLIQDLMHALDVPEDARQLSAPRRNVSLGWKATEAIRALVQELFKAGLVDDEIHEMNRILQIAGVVAECLGEERGEYLTVEQRTRCDALTATMLAEINTLLPGHALQHREARSPTARLFLPGFEHLSKQELLLFFANLVLAMLRERRGPARGADAEAVPRRKARIRAESRDAAALVANPLLAATRALQKSERQRWQTKRVPRGKVRVAIDPQAD